MSKLLVEFMQIPASPDEETMKYIRKLVDLIADGFKIISAVGQAHSVQYILTKEAKK